MRCLELLLDLPLELGVERGRGFVEDQDRRVAQQCPRDRDALPLPARQQRAAVAHDRVEPERRAVPRTRSPAPPAPRPRSARGSRGMPKAMLLRIVSLNSTTSWLTRLICARRSPSAYSRTSYAVEQHAAAGDVVEPRQQADQRGLAAAGAADDRDGLARPRVKRHAAAAPASSPDGYWKRTSRYSTSPRARSIDRPPPSGLLRRVEHLEDALCRGDALLQRAGDVDQPAQWRRDQHQRGDERGEFADRHPALRSRRRVAR